jgi:amino acid permease
LAGCTGVPLIKTPLGKIEISILTTYRFAYAILAADELVAVTNSVKFRYDDGNTYLNWAVGENVDPAVWISLFLVLVIVINMLPVKVRGSLISLPSINKALLHLR